MTATGRARSSVSARARIASGSPRVAVDVGDARHGPAEPRSMGQHDRVVADVHEQGLGRPAGFIWWTFFAGGIAAPMIRNWSIPASPAG